MDQSVIHHSLEGLTQAAHERNRSIVGRIRRILTGFWNWNHQSLPPRWGDVPNGPNVIENFKENMQAGFRKSLPTFPGKPGHSGFKFLLFMKGMDDLAALSSFEVNCPMLAKSRRKTICIGLPNGSSRLFEN
ncbi:hypothetical protein PoB_000754300 [Plakobranchus ocellatus]|uniref:Uncharacterized protein n=1 Tax=Plakobranchus ocellatus TaxID=259542 RepID=A0AAV3YFY0_9GAST|nr:hypothetical protein PoB_000754300 [Plakobranchus ocellatus]